jgi:hypothetical protein
LPHNRSEIEPRRVSDLISYAGDGKALVAIAGKSGRA